MILSIDTSLPTLSLALVAEQPVGAIALQGEGSRNEKLLPSIDWLLGECGVDLGGISLLVVTRGPGSFTGVRVGLATVQGLSFSREIPICAMSTHEAALGLEISTAVVYGNAGRGELYLSAFRDGEEVIPPSLKKPDELEALEAEYGHAVELSTWSRTSNLALSGALRARWLRENDRLSSYRDATPIYVRLSEAEVRLNQKRHDLHDPSGH